MVDQIQDINLGIDAQEMAEREEAADAYAGENPQHFVNYMEACVKESKDASEELRKVQDECWKAYLNQIDYSDKEDWQAKIVTNKPFASVKGGVSVVRKAFEAPDYLTVKGMQIGDVDITDIVKKSLKFWLNEQHGNFPLMFTDATEMSFVVGQSFEIVPHWDDVRGLIIDLIPPWQIWRDPDAKPRDPWSGNYWIHEEWIDHWVLLEGEKEGIFQNIENVTEARSGLSDREKEERRKGMYWQRSQFRKSVLTSEFFGVVLGPKGDLLLPNATFTVAGREIIRPPRPNPFARMRWPGTSFSPFPHLLRFSGRGILEGVLSVWWVLCNLLCLHIDNLAWSINKLREIDPSVLLDPGDAGEIYPGKVLVKKSGQSANQAIKTVDERGNTTDVLANANYFDQLWQNGAFVNEFVVGLPGTRSRVTKGEVAMKTQQSLGVFDSIGADLEAGAVNAVWAIVETIVLNWTENSNPSITRVFGQEFMRDAQAFARMPIEERKQLLASGADIQVSGISAQLSRSDMLEKLQVFTRLAESPNYAPYIKPYELLQANAEALNEPSAKFIVSPDEAKQIQQALNAALPKNEEEVKRGIEKTVTEKRDSTGNVSVERKQKEKVGG